MPGDEDKSIIKQEPQSALLPLGADPEQLIAEVKKHLEVLEQVKGLLKEDVHYRIDRKGKKVMKRSGFALYSYIFQLAEDTEPIEQELTYETPKTYTFSAYRNQRWTDLTETTDFRGFRIKVKIIHVPSGRVSWGVAGCTMEEYNIQSKMGDGRWYHDCLATAYTRAMNRAISNIIGSAEISDEEMGGKDNDETTKSVKVVEAGYRVKDAPITIVTPSWYIKNAIEMQGWEDAANIVKTFIDNMGLDIDSFDIQVDLVKVTAKPLVTYTEDTFKAVDEVLQVAGFTYVKTQKLWRFNKPENIPVVDDEKQDEEPDPEEAETPKEEEPSQSSHLSIEEISKLISDEIPRSDEFIVVSDRGTYLRIGKRKKLDEEMIYKIDSIVEKAGGSWDDDKVAWGIPKDVES